MPRSKSQHKEGRASRESFSNKPYMLLRCWGEEGRKAKRTHLLRGGGGFLTIDRNLLLNSNRKHLTIPQTASTTTTTSTSSRRCKSSHSRETQLISTRFRKITRGRRNTKIRTLTLIHCLHTLFLKTLNPNSYSKIWPFLLCNFSFVCLKVCIFVFLHSVFQAAC